MKKMKRMGKKGYTLVELMVVVTVMAILAATATGIYTGYIEKAKSAAVLNTARQVKEALMVCEAEYLAGDHEDEDLYWNDAFLKAPNHPDSILYPYVGEVTADCTNYTLKIGKDDNGVQYIKGFIYETDKYSAKWIKGEEIQVTKK